MYQSECKPLAGIVGPRHAELWLGKVANLRNFAQSQVGRLFAVGLLTPVSGGCGGADRELSPAIMVEAEHSHYHVHAVDASHEHTHANELGGHEHSHQHSEGRVAN